MVRRTFVYAATLIGRFDVTPLRNAFISAAALASVVVANGASAQPAPAPSTTIRAAVVAMQTSCPLTTRVNVLNDAHTQYTVSLRSQESGRASGILSLWAGDRRYDIGFQDLVTLDVRDLTTPDATVVVRFPAPTALDGAVVTSLEEGGSRRSCDPWFSPWVPLAGPYAPPPTPEQVRRQGLGFAGTRVAVTVDAPAALSDPKPCTTPDRPASTVRAFEPETPGVGPSGFAMVQVLLDTSNNVISARIQKSTGSMSLDLAALSAARRSEFQGQTFRCRRVIGSYLFGVEFND